MRKLLSLVVGAVLLSGCYHATVEVAPAAGVQQQGSSAGQVIDVPWAHGFIYGLIPPATVEARSKCTNGASKVETELSFLNMLASYVTFGLYTPMTITVTCR